jgi:hypothetical protein
MTPQSQIKNPWAILEIDPTASPEEIRRAYLEIIKRYPPDRHPEQFEQVRDAYEAVKDPRHRFRHVLFLTPPHTPLADLVRKTDRTYPFVGPKPWLDVLDPKTK